MRRLFLSLMGACLLVAGLAITPSALAGPKDSATKVAEVSLTVEAMNGFGSGKVIEWSTGNTQVKVNIEPDDSDGSVNDGTDSTGEWSLEFYSEACDARKGYPVSELFFANDPTYGPRINLIDSGVDIDTFAQGCIFLVHEGSTSTDHATELGYSGRHVLAEMSVPALRTL